MTSIAATSLELACTSLCINLPIVYPLVKTRAAAVLSRARTTPTDYIRAGPAAPQQAATATTEHIQPAHSARSFYGVDPVQRGASDQELLHLPLRELPSPASTAKQAESHV